MLKCNSSSNELSTPVADNVYLKSSFACTENDDVSGVRYPTDIKSVRFHSCLEASHRSNHTEE